MPCRSRIYARLCKDRTFAFNWQSASVVIIYVSCWAIVTTAKALRKLGLPVHKRMHGKSPGSVHRCQTKEIEVQPESIVGY
jgi:hypothetical protein